MKKRYKHSIEQYNKEWNNPDYCKRTDSDYLYEAYQYLHAPDDIDDLTWTDLEMDGLYEHINHCKTNMGEIVLYKMLRNPVSDAELLKQRNYMIDFFMNHEKVRNEKRVILQDIGDHLHFSIYEYKDLCLMSRFNLIPNILCIFFFLASLFMLWVSVSIGVTLTVIAFVCSIIVYNQKRIILEKYIPFINQIATMIFVSREISHKVNDPIVDSYLEKIELSRSIRKRYTSISQLVNMRANGKLSEFDALFDYVRSIFHIDLFAFVIFNKRIEKDMKTLTSCYDAIGFIDAMISIAYFRNMLTVRETPYCTPVFGEHQIKAANLHNPLIQNCVENSFTIDRSMLITGSNATGKSTFLRTLGANCILAQTIYTVCAYSFQMPFLYVISSMNIRDNIFENDSFFMAEIKSIKRILEFKEQGRNLICFIDEILKGTNTVERIGASAEILKAIAGENTYCIISSHDIELAGILQNVYLNYHFREQITENGLSCDYLLRKGVTTSRNAIDLLKLLGFSDEIVQKAKENVDYFMKTGMWRA